MNIRILFRRLEILFSGIDKSIALPFLRIGTGFICLMQLFLLRNDFQLFYFENPFVPHDLSAINEPTWINLVSLPQISNLLFSPINISIHHGINIILSIYLMSVLLLIIGMQTRISALIAIFIQLLISKTSPLFNYGLDYFLTMSLWYCIIFPCGNRLSFDSFFMDTAKTESNNLYRRILQLHLCIAYFFSGLSKALGFNWWNGESLWKAIHSPYSNIKITNHLNWTGSYSWLYAFFGITVIFLELLYPIFICIPGSRKFWLFSIIMMHVFIAISLNLYLFSGIMLVWNISAFYFENKDITSTRSIIPENISYGL